MLSNSDGKPPPRETELTYLRKKVADLESRQSVILRMAKAMKVVEKRTEINQQFEDVRAAIVAFEILHQWVNWCEMETTAYEAKYGKSEDSMVTLLEKTQAHLSSVSLDFTEKKMTKADLMIDILRRRIERRQVGDKVVLTLVLPQDEQELIVKAIDKIDKERKGESA